MPDETFVAQLKQNAAYQGLDIDREMGKLQAWLLTPKGKGKIADTRQRLVELVEQCGATDERPAADRLSSPNTGGAMKRFDDFRIDLGGRSGVEIQTTCPQCSHLRKKSKVRCLSVNTVEGVWCCHHCDWRGTLKAGEESRSHPPKRIVRPVWNPPSDLPPLVREWFAKRGISEEIVARHCIALQLTYMPQLEEEASASCSHISANGLGEASKYRSVEGKTFAK